MGIASTPTPGFFTTGSYASPRVRQRRRRLQVTPVPPVVPAAQVSPEPTRSNPWPSLPRLDVLA